MILVIAPESWYIDVGLLSYMDCHSAQEIDVWNIVPKSSDTQDQDMKITHNQHPNHNQNPNMLKASK